LPSAEYLRADKEVNMEKQYLGWFSISDDDLCSDCISLLYRPGGFSYCQLDWPCELNEDLYVESCDHFAECIKGTNIAFVNIRLAHAIWEVLGDLPVNENNETDEQFLHFPVGTHREEIWHWLEDHVGIPVTDMMYKRVPGYTKRSVKRG
jgi:hypothetical protein